MPTEPQLPRALSRAAPRRFLSFPLGKRDDSYHLSDAQLSSVIAKVHVGLMQSNVKLYLSEKVLWHLLNKLLPFECTIKGGVRTFSGFEDMTFQNNIK